MLGAPTIAVTALEYPRMILRSLRPIVLLLLALGSIPGPTRAAGTAIRATGDDGVTITLAVAPNRLISLAPSVTEVLFALGLGPKVVGVDTATNYPPAAKALPRVADYSSGPNYERILALKPDLLVTATGIFSPQAIAKLRGLHLQVLVTGPRDIPAVLRDIVLVGVATGVSATAKTLVAGLQARIDRVKARIRAVTGRPRVFYEVDPTLYTAAQGTYIDSMIALSGGTNIAAAIKNPYPQLSNETLIADDPQYIILGDSKPFAGGVTVARVAARPGWSVISAVKDRHIYPFDDDLASRPGPRIVLGIEAMAHLLHPEAFK